MVEIKNAQVFGLERAINAINNSFNVGEIDTTTKIPENDKKWNVAKALFGNKDYKQSHNASAAGVIVQFEIICNSSLKEKLNEFHFLEMSKLKNGSYFITTNFRQLSHIINSKNYFQTDDEKEFITNVLKIPKLKELCKL